MLCENDDKAKERFGAVIAKQFQSRLADMLSVANIRELCELPVGNPTELLYTSLPAIQIEFGKSNKFIFICNHDKTPLKSEKIDWSKVYRVQIIDIN